MLQGLYGARADNESLSTFCLCCVLILRAQQIALGHLEMIRNSDPYVSATALSSHVGISPLDVVRFILEV
jgi:hypothetical protein